MAFDLSDELNYKVSARAICPSGFGDGSKTDRLQKKYNLDNMIAKRINKLNKPQAIGNAILKSVNANLCTLGPEHIWELQGYVISDDKNSIYYTIQNVHKNANFFTNIYKINVKVSCIK